MSLSQPFAVLNSLWYFPISSTPATCPFAAPDDSDQEVMQWVLRHVAEAQKVGQDDDERIELAQSKQLRAILDAAEARTCATGGIRHEDLWNQLDAEYEALTPDSLDSC